jgi:hypothetical protein
MPRFFDTLYAEIICEIVKILPLNNARNFLSCGSVIYRPGKHTFNQNCFRVLPVKLSYNRLFKTEQLLGIEPSHFIQKIFIKMEALRETNSSEYEDRLDEDRLGFILEKAFQASTKFNTITIHYDPDYYDMLSYSRNTEFLAMALGTTLEHQQTTDLRIQIQNIRPDDYRALSCLKQSFLYSVYFLILRIEKYDWLGDFKSLRSLARNLTEFSVITNALDFLPTFALGNIIKRVNIQTLESITLERVNISMDKLPEILSPIRSFFKKLQLQQIMFRQESFITFIQYISDNFSLDRFSLSLEDI